MMSLEEEFTGMIFAKGLKNLESKLIVGENVIIQGRVNRDEGSDDAKVFINDIGEAK